jgi:molybdate transport system substrate-binding protein
MRRLIPLCLALLLPLTAYAEDLVVFAAASLQNAFQEIGARFERDTGHRVRFSFAASSTLARQIEHGGPAAVFASADEQWMDYLQQRDLIVAATRRSAIGNRLVLITPVAGAARVELRRGMDFLALLGREGRWVTGDPDSVPVGRYARQSLQWLGVWNDAAPRLVRAENVRVALAFVERGEVAAGIVYETDAAVSGNVRVAAVFPEESHSPVSYPITAIKANDSPAAREFIAYLDGGPARGVLRRLGFFVR